MNAAKAKSTRSAFGPEPRRRARGSAVALTVLLAGCATYEPRPLDPVAELAGLGRATLEGLVVTPVRVVPIGRSQGTSKSAPVDLADGLSEHELVAVGLTLNPQLKATRLAIGESQAFLITAGIWPNPSVGAGFRPGIGGATGYTLNASLLFELLAPGERAARIDAAKAHSESVRAKVIAEEWQLVTDVRRQWLAVLAAEKTVALLAQEVALRGEAVAHLRRRRELGEGTELDVVTATLEHAQIKRDLRLAETGLQSARRRLNQLVGLPPEYSLKLTDSGKPLSVTVAEDLQDAELESYLLGGRFELRSMHAEYQQAEHELRLAVARQYPHLKLGPGFGHENDEGDFLGIGIAIPIPLFDRNQGRIAEKQSARERLRAEYVALLHSLRAGAYESRARLRRAKLEVDAQQRELLPALERNRVLFEGAFKARDISVLEWVTARQRALEAQEGYLEALVQYRRAGIEFESSIGLRVFDPGQDEGRK